MATAKPNHLRPTNLRAPWARPFWDGLAERKLLAQRCARCRLELFPPRPLCPQCLRSELEWVELSGRGTLHSWTEVRVASPEFDTPFLLGLVDLEGGIGRLTARIAGARAADLAIGMPVHLEFADLEGGFTLYCIALG